MVGDRFRPGACFVLSLCCAGFGAARRGVSTLALVGLEGVLKRHFLILAGLLMMIPIGSVEAGNLVSRPFKVADSCVASCRAAHNQCRIATRGSSACDRKLQQCLKRCLRR